MAVPSNLALELAAKPPTLGERAGAGRTYRLAFPAGSRTMRSTVSEISLAPGAEDNGLANMLADLVRQNLEAKPHKKSDFSSLQGDFAIVAEDAEVALTLRFAHGKLTIHDGIVGVPDVTIRGGSDTILALSNLPLTRLGKVVLPVPDPRDKQAVSTLKSVFGELTQGRFHIYGLAFHLPMLMRLTRVMSVNG